MKNVIILNLKSVFLPDTVLQTDKNKSFLEGSAEKKIENCPYFDPFAVKEIQKIIAQTNSQVVITDNWFWTKDFAITKHWCNENGLFLPFHKNFITPKKMSSMRINEVQWWIANNPDDRVILILDENYSMRNLVENAKNEQDGHKDYLKNYSSYIGEKRRKSIIPTLEYMRYENFDPFYGVEAKTTVCINEENGITKEVLQKALELIKKPTV